MPAASPPRRLAFRPARAAAAVLLAAAAACAHAPSRGGCSLPGSRPWREYRSAHFDIAMPEGAAEPGKVVRALEELHAAVVAALIAEPVEIPGRVRVVVLPSVTALEGVVGARDIRGVFHVSRLAEPTILLSVDAVERMPQVVAHELAHHVSRHLFPRQPRWFSEGLAQFVESVAVVDGEGRRWAGGEPASGWAVDGFKLTPAHFLFSYRETWLSSAYLTSWVLYRFLWNERSDGLAELQRHLMQGDAPADAWRAAFPQWDPAGRGLADLDALLERHRRNGRGLRWVVTIGEVDRSYTEAPASRADLHLALLPFELGKVNRVLAARTHRAVVAEALRDEPSHPGAVAELAAADGTPAAPALRAALAAHPGDGRGWYLLARAVEDPREREVALRRAIELWPGGALPRAALAAELARTGRGREAVREANAALELAPWNAEIIATLAGVALELGKCREALVLADRAAEVASAHDVGAMGVDAEGLGRERERIRGRCAGGAAATSGSP